MECTCCVHQQIYEGWPRDEWCQPVCVLKCIPLWAWGMWELLGLCLVPVSVAMSAIWKIGLEEYKHFNKRAGVLEEDEEDIYSLLQDMLNTWQGFQTFPAIIEQKDIDLLRELNDEQETE